MSFAFSSSCPCRLWVRVRLFVYNSTRAFRCFFCLFQLNWVWCSYALHTHTKQYNAMCPDGFSRVELRFGGVGVKRQTITNFYANGTQCGTVRYAHKHLRVPYMIEYLHHIEHFFLCIECACNFPYVSAKLIAIFFLLCMHVWAIFCFVLCMFFWVSSCH